MEAEAERAALSVQVAAQIVEREESERAAAEVKAFKFFICKF